MATKKEVLEAAARGEGCLGRAADDEPVFVLRAHDSDAPEIVLAWAKARAQAVIDAVKPIADIDQVRDAIQVADAMEEWRHEEQLRKGRELLAERGGG